MSQPIIGFVGAFVAWILGYSIWAIALAIYGLVNVYKPFSLWKKSKLEIQSLEARISNEESNISIADSNKAGLLRELSLLNIKCKEIQDVARESVNEFESICLKKPSRMLPFSSPYNCSEGDFIRLKEGAIAELKERMNRDVELNDSLFTWLIATSLNKKPLYELYRVITLDNKRIVLSRIKAYLS
jgi:hypothetical protein